jgi:hypothetical protein
MKAIGPVLAHVVRQHLDPLRQVAVRVATHAVLGECLERMGWVVPEPEIVHAADLRVRARDDDRALLREHPPELAEARPVGRPLDDEPIALLAHSLRMRAAALRASISARLSAVVHRLRATECGEDGTDVVDAAGASMGRNALADSSTQTRSSSARALRAEALGRQSVQPPGTPRAWDHLLLN